MWQNIEQCDAIFLERKIFVIILFIAVSSSNVIQYLLKLFIFSSFCSWLHPQAIWYNICLKLFDIFIFLFMTTSSRRPNGVYIRAGGSINLWLRSAADNNLLLIKCSAPYKTKNRNLCVERNKTRVNESKRLSGKKEAIAACERKAGKASLKRSFRKSRTDNRLI